VNCDEIEIQLDPNSVADYRLFLQIKSLPRYRFVGRVAYVPSEYAGRLGVHIEQVRAGDYQPHSKLFDYQEAISRIAIRKQKYAGFIECGYGKTMIIFEFGRHANEHMNGRYKTLIISPLMVIPQTISEYHRFYDDHAERPISQVRAKDLGLWMETPGIEIGITNYEAITREIPQGLLGCLIIDESSYLKSHYGRWGTEIIRLGRGIDWKLSLTGTPAPNDRIEFANQAVFLDAFPTVNSFLAKFFVNRGQTDNRWEMKPHALRPFYRALSDWSIFMTNPATYGWKDNAGGIPPIETHIHDVELTHEQNRLATEASGTLFPMDSGGITTRSQFAQLAKGKHNGKDVHTNRPAFIRSLTETWPTESTLIWCRYNDEQKKLATFFPECANIAGETPMEKRAEFIKAFQDGQIKVCISKPKVMGFGLNLQVATRQVFSTCMDSWEEFHQAVKRSNRVGSTKPLNVHIPTTPLETPMVVNVLRKAKRIDEDTKEQEALFYEQFIG
jgi:Helicase conserved C-terminal domain